MSQGAHDVNCRLRHVTNTYYGSLSVRQLIGCCTCFRRLEMSEREYPDLDEPRELGGSAGQPILEERAKIRGDYTIQSIVSQQFKAYVRQSPGYRKLTSDQCESLDHICEKIARILTGDPNELDAWADISGYATLIHNKLKGGKHV